MVGAGSGSSMGNGELERALGFGSPSDIGVRGALSGTVDTGPNSGR